MTSTPFGAVQCSRCMAHHGILAFALSDSAGGGGGLHRTVLQMRGRAAPLYCRAHATV